MRATTLKQHTSALRVVQCLSWLSRSPADVCT